MNSVTDCYLHTEKNNGYRTESGFRQRSLSIGSGYNGISEQQNNNDINTKILYQDYDFPRLFSSAVSVLRHRKISAGRYGKHSLSAEPATEGDNTSATC